MRFSRALSVLTLLLPVAFSFALTARAEVDPIDELPGPDAPPVGRSLFDHLTATASGFEIKFPIEDLIQSLQQKTGVTPKAVLVPKGRSLQRDHADFAKPRLIYAFDDFQRQDAQSLGYGVKDRLYVAFAEGASQIEVISYNAAAGRYEFQIIKDYSAAGAKTLAYASRGLCVKCHHNGAPIFNPNPWPETNGTALGDARIADLIKQAQNGATSYHGTPVATPRSGAPYDVDKSVDRANYVSAYQKLWTTGCGDGDAGAQCRANTLKLALEVAFSGFPPHFSEDSPAYTALQATWAQTWAAAGPLQGGIKIPEPKVLPFFPLEQAHPSNGFEDLNPEGLTPAQLQQIRDMLAHSEVPREVDPLFQFLGAREVWTLDSICYGKCLIYGVSRFFTDADKALLKQTAGNSYQRAAQAVDALLQQNSPALAARPFRRGTTVKALVAAMGGNAPAVVGEDDRPQMAAPTIDAGDENELTSPLVMMRRYCLPCHVELPGDRSFLRGGSEAEIKGKIAAKADDIKERLNWEAEASANRPHMPQTGTSQRTQLAQHDDHRSAISAWVMQVKAECQANPTSCQAPQGGGQ
jgi:hypothetical protein